MTTSLLRLIEGARDKCLNGHVLSREEIVALLDIPPGSPEDKLLLETANACARLLTGNTGYIWCALGADFDSCPMNCQFCSLGEKWGIVRQRKTYSQEEILQICRSFAADGARYLVLRTTEFFSLDTLTELVRKIRRQVPGDYQVILNTGEFSEETAAYMASCGIDGIYHALRLREGIHTPFPPAQRLSTLDSVLHSPLKLVSLVEPVGCEHTNEELADSFLTVVKYRAEISGAMARIPVNGTPLGSIPAVSDDRMAHIIAVLRLSGGSVVRDICVHPPSKQALLSGANVMVVETGAVPRDHQLSSGSWEGFTTGEAKKLFAETGYQVWPENN